MDLSRIPVIDVAALIDPPKGISKAREALVKQLDEAFRNTGFMYIRNHGVPDAIQGSLLDLSKQFFAEPLPFKSGIAMKNSGKTWRGYFPVGGELTSGRPDQKEGIYFGEELPADHPKVNKGLPLHGPNQWPPGPKYAEFKSLVLTYMSEMTRLAHALMSGVGMGLGLGPDYFRARFTDEPTTLFRIFNYPRHAWSDESDEWGVREHTDMGFLTILLQDESGGLQVKAPDGHWIQAPPVAGTFVINIGDMLEVWTHGVYRATPHRVRNQGSGDRLSLPFFFDPNWDCTLESIDPKKIPARNVARWDGLDLKSLPEKMTYGEFVWSKVRKVFPDLA
jgi:isopenicillin N synthase-like dioxygenase